MQEILYPVGRLVGGSLYRSNDVTEADGKTPKLDADGKKKKSYSVGVAFPKVPGQHWGSSEWGAKIWAEGHAGFPNGEAQAATFAWKIIDGDSMIPNKRGNKPAENEGYPGHWVVWFSGTFAPKTCNANGSVQYTDNVERIKPGHFVQVLGTCKDNKPSQSPGVYQNFVMVAHSGFGPEIATGSSVDAAAVGFGATPLPAGASAVPLGQTALPGGAQPPATPGAPAIPAVAQVAQPAQPAAPAASSIVPNQAFLNPPVPGAMPAPGAVPMPAAPVVRTYMMTAAAQGYTREQFVASGQWTDDTLIAAGMMTAA